MLNMNLIKNAENWKQTSVSKRFQGECASVFILAMEIATLHHKYWAYVLKFYIGFLLSS